MIDAHPTRTSGDERAALLAHLHYQRASFVKKLTGLTEEQARWSPVPTGTSLLWLLRHLGRAEAVWVLDRFGRLDPDRDLLDNELQPGDTVAVLLERYQRVWRLVDDVIAANDLGSICHVDDDQDDPDLRWVLAHLASETARHAGHADILRELLDGSTGR